MRMGNVVRPGGGLLLSALAILVIVSGPLAAQTVVGNVSDEESGGPVEGVLVRLLDATGERMGGALTDARGRFAIRAPSPLAGELTLHAERIGMATAASEPFTLPAGETVRVDLRMRSAPILLEGLEVVGEGRCHVRPTEGFLVARLWHEAQKALENQQWAEREDLLRFRVVEYRRELDVERRLVLSEEREPGQWFKGVPIRSRTAEDLLERGFVRPTPDGGHEFFGPDASVLLSDPFLDTHCFRLTTRRAEPGVVGLAFEPLENRGVIDITGTLWLDEADARLRSLDFNYTAAPWPEAAGVASGRVEFEEIDGGIWIVRRWRIQMPNMVRNLDRLAGGRSGLQVASIVESGGAVTRITSLADRVTDTGRTGAVAGVVWDSTRSAPLPGATVTVASTGRTGTTNADGEFRIADVPVGPSFLAFHHPRLDTLGVRPSELEIAVDPGRASRVDLAVPSWPSIIGALCTTAGGPEGASVVAGTVREGEGGPVVPGAEVRLEWTDWRFVGAGREIRSDVQTLEVSTDTEGRFRACGVPPGVILGVRASSAGAEGGVRRVRIPRQTLVTLDLRLEPEQSTEPSTPEPACPGPGTDGTGAVSGRVTDAATDVPIGRMVVWLTPEGDAEARSTTADAAGWFSFCEVEAGAYTLRTSIRDLGEARQPLTVRSGAVARARLELALQDEMQETGSLLGRVVAAEDGRPLEGVELRLGDRGAAISRSNGAFAFSGVPTGSTTLRASYLGREDAERDIAIGGGQSITVEIRLSVRPIELEPIVVTAVRSSSRGLLGDVRRRARSAFGTVLTEERLDAETMRATRVTDILQKHGATVLSNGSALLFNRSQCAPHVYVDGMKVTHLPRSGGGGRRAEFEGVSPEEEAAQALDMVLPRELAAVEIYKGPAEIPGEFLDSDARCGVILLWTRRGDDMR